MIQDWDDAYANSPRIPGAADYPPKWARDAAGFRQAMTGSDRAELDIPYGAGPRDRLDLFRPVGAAKGLAVFVHGGYWMAFDKSSWSHLAAGAVARGWAVAMPSYTLCPEARISEITRQVGKAVAAAADRIAGPIRLAGHSAGGHLVTRMACTDGPMPEPLRARLARVASISGLHDLRPLMRTRMNATLRLDAAEAEAESAALREPLPGLDLLCWVGADERPEFRRQNALLANIWAGLGARRAAVAAAGRHHFDVIADLSDPDSPLVEAWVGGSAASA
ncbi:MAG: alpha/beta hydrolase [Thalassobaculum sp.]|uniref:alpha/beta hydrolase n=1 Tax=Thalassobaculum sp. TaxID=2022740 RepID=UPI0032EB1438